MNFLDLVLFKCFRVAAQQAAGGRGQRQLVLQDHILLDHVEHARLQGLSGWLLMIVLPLVTHLSIQLVKLVLLSKIRHIVLTVRIGADSTWLTTSLAGLV